MVVIYSFPQATKKKQQQHANHFSESLLKKWSSFVEEQVFFFVCFFDGVILTIVVLAVSNFMFCSDSLVIRPRVFLRFFTQPAITFSKLIIETLEKSVKYVQS